MAQTPEELRAKKAAYYAAHRQETCARVRAYRGAHVEEERARKAAYRAAHREAEMARSATHYAAHREERLAKGRAYRAAHLQERRAQESAYDVAHRAARRAYQAAYRAERREARRSYQSAYAALHPETAATNQRRRRAAKLNAPVNDFTGNQWREMLAHYDHRCVYCGRKMQRLEQDHLTPLSKGGAHTHANIVPACRSCNSKKYVGPPPIPVQPLLLTVAPKKPRRR